MAQLAQVGGLVFRTERRRGANDMHQGWLGLSQWKGRVPALLLLVMAVSQPAFAQVDISGLWRPLARNQDGSGMTGDSAGLPAAGPKRGQG